MASSNLLRLLATNDPRRCSSNQCSLLLYFYSLDLVGNLRLLEDHNIAQTMAKSPNSRQYNRFDPHSA